MKVSIPTTTHDNMYRAIWEFTTFFNRFVRPMIDLDLVKLASWYTDVLGPIHLHLIGVHVRMSMHVASEMVTADLQASLYP